MTTIKKIFKIIYYLIFAVIATVAIFLVLSVFPTKSGYRTFIVLSGSMEPKIHTGSVVAVKEQKEYQVGDVVSFGESTKTKKPTTHRIFEIKEEKGKKVYVTKGDANKAPDQQTVKGSEILGRIFLSIPYVGYAVAATQKPLGFMLIIVIPCVILIYDEALNIKKEILKKIDYRKRMKKKKETEENKKGDENNGDNKKEDEKTEEKI